MEDRISVASAYSKEIHECLSSTDIDIESICSTLDSVVENANSIKFVVDFTTHRGVLALLALQQANSDNSDIVTCVEQAFESLSITCEHSLFEDTRHARPLDSSVLFAYSVGNCHKRSNIRVLFLAPFDSASAISVVEINHSSSVESASDGAWVSTTPDFYIFPEPRAGSIIRLLFSTANCSFAESEVEYSQQTFKMSVCSFHCECFLIFISGVLERCRTSSAASKLLFLGLGGGAALSSLCHRSRPCALSITAVEIDSSIVEAATSFGFSHALEAAEPAVRVEICLADALAYLSKPSTSDDDVEIIIIDLFSKGLPASFVGVQEVTTMAISSAIARFAELLTGFVSGLNTRRSQPRWVALNCPEASLASTLRSELSSLLGDCEFSIATNISVESNAVLLVAFFGPSTEREEHDRLKLCFHDTARDMGV